MTHVLIGAWAVLLPSGCALMGPWTSNGWLSDYEKAERKVAENGRPLLIIFKDSHFGLNNTMERSLMDPNVRRRTSDYVRCCLLREYERDRRYAAQFGVHRTPALIVLRPDRTFHARTGAMAPVDVVDFLLDAAQPGLAYASDGLLPRRPDYRWYDNVKEARITAIQQDLPVLHVFHRPLTRDWRNIRRLLRRPEVYRRFAGMIHCRINSWQGVARKTAEQFGVTRWPAVVIELPDGRTEILEQPVAYEELVRFADRSLERGAESVQQPGIVGAISGTRRQQP